jgi:transposase
VNGELLMTAEDRKRLYIVKQTYEGKITKKEAAKLLDMSARQVKRICKRMRQEGDQAVLHKNRGRKSNRSIARSIKERVVRLCREKYKGFGPTLACEQLLKNEKIEISDETLRLWLIENKLPYGKRKERPHRQWRERKKHFGEMLQMDGSHHDWLNGRGPKMVLMGYVDDATSRAFGKFYEYEGTMPALDGLIGYIKNSGIPCSVYLDKHRTYKGFEKMKWADELDGDTAESQFQKALRTLRIAVVHANSPQAKGRIERFFRTLQDRLVKEMDLLNISTLDEANRYLSTYLREHNRKFGVVPESDVDLHRPVGNLCIEDFLCIKTRRYVRNDFTVFHNGRVYQIETRIRAKWVVVLERTDGTTYLWNRDQQLPFHEIDRKIYLRKRAEEVKEGPGNLSHHRKPPKNHPWRQFNPNYLSNREGDISTLVKR